MNINHSPDRLLYLHTYFLLSFPTLSYFTLPPSVHNKTISISFSSKLSLFRSSIVFLSLCLPLSVSVTYSLPIEAVFQLNHFKRLAKRTSTLKINSHSVFFTKVFRNLSPNLSPSLLSLFLSFFLSLFLFSLCLTLSSLSSLHPPYKRLP